MICQERKREICKETVTFYKLHNLGKLQTGADYFLFKNIDNGQNSITNCLLHRRVERGAAKLECFCKGYFIHLVLNGVGVHGGVDQGKHIHINTPDKHMGIGRGDGQNLMNLFADLLEMELPQADRQIVEGLIGVDCGILFRDLLDR